MKGLAYLELVILNVAVCGVVPLVDYSVFVCAMHVDMLLSAAKLFELLRYYLRFFSGLVAYFSDAYYRQYKA